MSKSTSARLVSRVKPAPGSEGPKPGPETLAADKDPANESAGKSAGKQSVAGTSSPNEERRGLSLPPPESTEPRPKKVGERAESTSPPEIPKGIPPPPRAAVQPKAAPQIFKDERSAIRAEGSGLFDTQGFPLGEYAHAIIERIKGNWSIPSNLRNSQGRSTVVFFIEKDGSVSNLKIVVSSGSQSLDLSALWAVLLSKPLPPLPGGFPGEHVGAKFVFSYNEP